MSQADWDKLAEQEAKTLATMLATEGKCVLVVVIGAESDHFGTTHMVQGVAGDTRGAHLRQFIVAVERKLAWLRDKLIRREKA